MENARIVNYVRCNDSIWFTDDIYGGLYSIDILNSSGLTECHITPSDYLMRGNYKVVEMINTEDAILTIPLDMHNPMRIYDKKSKSESIKKIDGINHIIEGAIYNENRDEIILIPALPSDPLCAIHVDDYTVRTIKNRLLEDSLDGEIWEHNSINSFAITVSCTPFMIKMNMNDASYKTIKLKDGERIKSAFFNEDIWVLPFNGKHIKKYDEEGNLNNTVDISGYGVLDDYVRIISIKNRVILIPKNGACLLIYNPQVDSMLSVDLSEEKMINRYSNHNGNDIAYWQFYIEEATICLLPLARKMIKYNLENDNYWFEDIYSVSDPDIDDWASQKMKIDINEYGMVKEESKNDLKTFLSII